MAFSQMLELLKEKEKGAIVFVKLDAFYIATEEDAVLLHKILDLKCICFKMNICSLCLFSIRKMICKNRVI